MLAVQVWAVLDSAPETQACGQIKAYTSACTLIFLKPKQMKPIGTRHDDSCASATCQLDILLALGLAFLLKTAEQSPENK